MSHVRRLHHRVSRRLSPFILPALTQSLAALGIVGVSGGLLLSWFSSAGNVVLNIGLLGMISLFLVCALVRVEDLDAAQIARAERLSARKATRAVRAEPLPEILEA